MKCTTDVESRFTPVTITITCETADELRLMWHLANMSLTQKESIYNNSSVAVPKWETLESTEFKLFNPINRAINASGLKETEE